MGSQKTEADDSRERQIGLFGDPEEEPELPKRTGDRVSILSPAGNPSKERLLEHCEPQSDELLNSTKLGTGEAAPEPKPLTLDVENQSLPV